MNNTGIIDHFLEVFTHYIDSGFGLLGGDVNFIASTLIVIDVTLASLFWAWGGEDDILARLVKKILFIGAFAYVITHWNALARIIFESFAGFGLKAAGSGFTVADLMRPGKLAQLGLDAGQPLMQTASDLMGSLNFFENFVQICCLMLAWLIIVLAFFCLAIQIFVTLVEFKLTTLAGFILIPFGLFGKSAFMAERVLGNVISSGIKILVLSVVTGIGSTLFASFIQSFANVPPTIGDAMSIVLAALTLLGMGIFGPSIANGLVSGGPQLSAGSAVGTALAAGGFMAAGVAGVGMAAGAASAAASTGLAATRGAASLAGAATTAYNLGALGKSGASAVAGGVSNIAKSASQGVVRSALSPLKAATTSLGDSFKSGAQSAFTASGGTIKSTDGSVTTSQLSQTGSGASDTQPAWARRMKQSQVLHQGLETALHAVRSADANGAGSSVNLKEGQ